MYIDINCNSMCVIVDVMIGCRPRKSASRKLAARLSVRAGGTAARTRRSRRRSGIREVEVYPVWFQHCVKQVVVRRKKRLQPVHMQRAGDDTGIRFGTRTRQRVSWRGVQLAEGTRTCN